MFIRHNIPAILWALVILGLCSMPGKSIPKIEWLELLSFDKFVHASIFFVLQLLSMRGFYLQNNFSFLKKFYTSASLLLCIAYGGALEIMQSTIFTDRSGDVLDFVANSCGCLAGFFLFKKLKRFLFL